VQRCELICDAWKPVATEQVDYWRDLTARRAVPQQLSYT
jgi:hypothetical protein